MNQRELKKCAICDKGVAHNRNILATRVVVTRMAINIGAVQRQHGLEQMLGGSNAAAAIAAVMGPDEDMLVELGRPVTLLVCDDCAMTSRIGELWEHEHAPAERAPSAPPGRESSMVSSPGVETPGKRRKPQGAGSGAA